MPVFKGVERKMTYERYGDDMYKKLFPDDPLRLDISPIPKSHIEPMEDPEKDWGDDFYMEHAMTLGKGFDKTYRDNYGNYNKDTEWYRMMEQEGFPYGEDEMPELLENDEYYD